MSDTTTLWLCGGVGFFGLAVAAGIIYFGLTLYRRSDEVSNLLRQIERNIIYLLEMGRPPTSLSASAEAIARTVADILADSSQRRSEVATTYAQLLVATTIIIVLTILLIVNAISAEAGLPILSGISGFVIAKGPAIGRAITQTPQREERTPEG